MAEGKNRKTPPNIRFTPEKLAAMKQQLEDGTTTLQLAEQERVTPGRINYLLRKHALTTRPDPKFSVRFTKPA